MQYDEQSDYDDELEDVTWDELAAVVVIVAFIVYFIFETLSILS